MSFLPLFIKQTFARPLLPWWVLCRSLETPTDETLVWSSRSPQPAGRTPLTQGEVCIVLRKGVLKLSQS